MTMMVAGAVLVHFGIVVGVGAWWHQTVVEQKDDSTIIDVVGPGLESNDENVQYLPVNNTAPTPSQESSTPIPDAPVQPDLLPPEVVPEMPEPSDVPPPKPRRTSPQVTNPAAKANPARTVPGASGASTGNTGTLGGAPNIGRTGIQGWQMPGPHYPAALRAAGFQGATTVRITTDASGNIITVDIVRSAGNALMDRNTQMYVREFWKGPPNATRTTEVVYRMF